MARFYGKVGFGQTQDQGNGVHGLVVHYRNYYGDETQNYKTTDNSQQVNSEFRTSTLISIVSDSYANENLSAIRYVEWKGVLWKVAGVDAQHPRLLLRLGGVYNGPTGAIASTP
jgi:hypothetical protein